jgi:hypothetical protein
MKATFNARAIFSAAVLRPPRERTRLVLQNSRAHGRPKRSYQSFMRKRDVHVSRSIFFTLASCRMMAHTNRWILFFQNSMQDISGEVETKNDISLVLRLKVWLSFHHQRGTESSKSSCIFHAHTPCSAFFLFVEEYFSHFFSSFGWSFKSRDLIPLF